MDPTEIVRIGCDAWNAGDLRPVLHHVHPDVEWETSGSFPGVRGVYHGHEGVLRWREDISAPFTQFLITIVEMTLEDDVVTARVHFDAVGAASGAAVQLDFVNEWHFRDGLVVRYRAIPVD